MNQVEIWFSILARKLLKGNFRSLDDLNAKFCFHRLLQSYHGKAFQVDVQRQGTFRLAIYASMY